MDQPKKKSWLGGAVQSKPADGKTPDPKQKSAPQGGTPNRTAGALGIPIIRKRP